LNIEFENSVPFIGFDVLYQFVIYIVDFDKTSYEICYSGHACLKEKKIPTSNVRNRQVWRVCTGGHMK